MVKGGGKSEGPKAEGVTVPAAGAMLPCVVVYRGHKFTIKSITNDSTND